MTLLLPPYAYIPGETPRHAEGAFDEIRATVTGGMTLQALAQSSAFQHGLAWLENGYYWEAHEVLEPVWLALPDGDERRFVQGLIQLANALLKEQMGRAKAALRLCAMARALIGEGPAVMGFDRGAFTRLLNDLELRLGEFDDRSRTEGQRP